MGVFLSSQGRLVLRGATFTTCLCTRACVIGCATQRALCSIFCHARAIQVCSGSPLHLDLGLDLDSNFARARTNRVLTGEEASQGESGCRQPVPSFSSFAV